MLDRLLKVCALIGMFIFLEAKKKQAIRIDGKCYFVIKVITQPFRNL